jgi:hypothetical protein
MTRLHPIRRPAERLVEPSGGLLARQINSVILEWDSAKLRMHKALANPSLLFVLRIINPCADATERLMATLVQRQPQVFRSIIRVNAQQLNRKPAVELLGLSVRKMSLALTTQATAAILPKAERIVRESARPNNLNDWKPYSLQLKCCRAILHTPWYAHCLNAKDHQPLQKA